MDTEARAFHASKWNDLSSLPNAKVLIALPPQPSQGQMPL